MVTQATKSRSSESPEPNNELLSSEVAELNRQIKIAALRRQLSSVEASLEPLRRRTGGLDPAELLQKALLELDEKEIRLNIRKLDLPTEIIGTNRAYGLARTLAESPAALKARVKRIQQRNAGLALSGGDPSWRIRHAADKWICPEDQAKADLSKDLRESQSRLNVLQRELASIPERLAEIQKQRDEMKLLSLEPTSSNDAATRLVLPTSSEASPAAVDGTTLPKLRFATLGGSLTVQKPFTDEELLNTYEEISSLMDHVRTLVLANGDKTTADELQSTFTGTLLGNNASKENWQEWISDFGKKTTAKGATLVFLEKVTGVSRETLTPRFSRARAARRREVQFR